MDRLSPDRTHGGAPWGGRGRRKHPFVVFGGSDWHLAEHGRQTDGRFHSATQSPLRGALQFLLREAGEDLDQFREALKTWYDDNIDRVASWHKKHTQRAVVVIAAVIAIGANADTLHMARQLSTNDALRATAVQQAQRVAEQRPPAMVDTLADSEADSLANSLHTLVEAYGEQGLPLGWNSETVPRKNASVGTHAGFWASKLLGLLLTTIAISLGAPFWFDVLKMVSTIRSGGRSPREK